MIPAGAQFIGITHFLRPIVKDLKLFKVILVCMIPIYKELGIKPRLLNS